MFDEHADGHPGAKCSSRNMPPQWAKSCSTYLLVWTVGSEGVELFFVSVLLED
jgi:hypothetical protein